MLIYEYIRVSIRVSIRVFHLEILLSRRLSEFVSIDSLQALLSQVEDRTDCVCKLYYQGSYRRRRLEMLPPTFTFYEIRYGFKFTTSMMLSIIEHIYVYIVW